MNFNHFPAVNPDGDLIKLNGYLLVNNLCGLVGYYCAARVIDMPTVGRKKLQMSSFLACTVIFLITGGIFEKTSPQVLMFLYFLSSFLINFGPHVTAYVMAAETYPTELRGTCHGSESFGVIAFEPIVIFTSNKIYSFCVFGKGGSFARIYHFFTSDSKPNLLFLWSHLCRWCLFHHTICS